MDGQILTIAASGWTWHDKFVLQDLETGSLWWTGVGADGNDSMLCLAGPLQNQTLPIMNFFRGTWTSWVSRHPGSKYLKTK